MILEYNTHTAAADLRKLADFISGREDNDIQIFTSVFKEAEKFQIRRFVSNLDDLKKVARALGTFRKRYTDDYFELAVTISPTFELVFYTYRSTVCKQIITYECEDAESILQDLSPVAVTEDEIPF